jgi:5-oxoprolinase (ATP-hydrolysing)/N-methylhydantoinase B
VRFADKRYYIEAYTKCANCGVLIYDEGLKAKTPDGAEHLYCSGWCRDWSAQRETGKKPVLKLPLARVTKG